MLEAPRRVDSLVLFSPRPTKLRPMKTLNSEVTSVIDFRCSHPHLRRPPKIDAASEGGAAQISSAPVGPSVLFILKAPFFVSFLREFSAIFDLFSCEMRGVVCRNGPVLRSSRQSSHHTLPSGTPEVTLRSKLRRPMLRPKPRVTGGRTALTVSVRRKPPLPSLGVREG